MLSRRLAVSATTALLTLTLVAPTAEAARVGDFDAIAHRGFHRHHTENTLRALHAANRSGASAMELDLRITRDGHMIVMHDATLRRTTTCRGFVSKRTRHDIRRHCRAEDGSKIPFVGDVLKRAHRGHLNLMLEIKRDGRGRWGKHRFRVLKHTIFERHMQNRVMLISYDAERLRRASRVAPGLRTSWIAEGKPSVRAVLKRKSDSVSVSADLVTPRYVQRMNNAGIRVYGRRTNKRHEWHKLERAGVSGIVTDYMRYFKRWARR